MTPAGLRPKELIKTIEDYRNERVPLSKPITLIRHHARKHRIDHLMDQVYLNWSAPAYRC